MLQSWLQTACCLAVAAGMLLTTEQGRAAEDVSIGITNAASDIALFIADAKGFFKSEDIKPNFIAFDSAAKMIAPLGAGQLDVGGGAASSGLYNAIERGIGLRIVADKARNAPGFGFQSLLVRKALVNDGSVKSIADLRGRKVAIVAQASSDASVLNEALKSAGLGFDDVDKVYLGFPQQLVAYQNGAIDASITTEPTVTAILDSSTAVRLMSNDEFYPNAQTSVILYGRAFSARRLKVANGFMKAYVRAIRYYNDALSNGRIAAANADENHCHHGKLFGHQRSGPDPPDDGAQRGSERRRQCRESAKGLDVLQEPESNQRQRCGSIRWWIPLSLTEPQFCWRSALIDLQNVKRPRSLKCDGNNGINRWLEDLMIWRQNHGSRSPICCCAP